MDNLFCARVKDKVSGKTLYLNFRASSQVDPPELDLDSNQFAHACIEDGETIKKYQIPCQTSPLFRSKENNSDYVIFVRINDSFARRRVLQCLFIRDYVVSVCMSVVMDVLNEEHARIGHRFDLDHAGYSLLKDRHQVEPLLVPI